METAGKNVEKKFSKLIEVLGTSGFLGQDNEDCASNQIRRRTRSSLSPLRTELLVLHKLSKCSATELNRSPAWLP